MLILQDPRCVEYAAPGHPEAPFRVRDTAALLRAEHPGWEWREPARASDEDLLRVHSPEHLRAVAGAGEDFDADTPAHPGIGEHARRAAGAALDAMRAALGGQKAFSLMRPPGHHALRDRAMGFCYFGNVAVAVLAARAGGAGRVAVWDFDAHHGNGTEALLHGAEGTLAVSIHQWPGWPGTGTKSFDNCRNFPVAPHAPPTRHLEILERSWEEVLAFQPDLVLVSAGFDAYAGDPITQMSLRAEDFATLGRWLREASQPAAAALEGGYARELPRLVEGFLAAWAG